MASTNDPIAPESINASHVTEMRDVFRKHALLDFFLLGACAVYHARKKERFPGQPPRACQGKNIVTVAYAAES